MLPPKFRSWIVRLLLTLALAVTPAYSTTITTYNSLSTWQAATTGVQTLDFESLSTGTYSGGLTDGGVQFIGYSSYPASTAIWDTSAYPWTDYGTGKAVLINIAGSTMPYLEIVLPSPVTAIGMNLFSANPNGLSFTVSVLSTPNTVATSATAPPTFFGVTSDTPFQTIDVSLPAWSSHSGAYQFLDNFSDGTASLSDAPEATTFLLIGTGLIGIAILRTRMNRRKKQNVAG